MPDDLVDAFNYAVGKIDRLQGQDIYFKRNSGFSSEKGITNSGTKDIPVRVKRKRKIRV